MFRFTLHMYIIYIQPCETFISSCFQTGHTNAVRCAWRARVVRLLCTMCQVRTDTWTSPYSQPCERAFVVAYLMQSSLNMDYSQCERDLLAAIEAGQLERVKQLVGSGVEASTVLHSKARRESATVLGTAAYEGQLHILRYLLTDSALNVNYRDPCLGRSALHWACMGGHYPAVLALLKHSGIDVNRSDKDNVTPLIMASIYANTDASITNALIAAGADVCRRDRLNASALHYATDHRCSEEVVRSLITAGCVASNAVVFGEGSPLANLLERAFSPQCVQLLLAAGYKLQDSPPPALALQAHDGAMSLRALCRVRIRAHLGGVHLQKKITTLPLPTQLIDDLLLKQIL